MSHFRITFILHCNINGDGCTTCFKTYVSLNLFSIFIKTRSNRYAVSGIKRINVSLKPYAKRSLRETAVRMVPGTVQLKRWTQTLMLQIRKGGGQEQRIQTSWSFFILIGIVLWFGLPRKYKVFLSGLASLQNVLNLDEVQNSQTVIQAAARRSLLICMNYSARSTLHDVWKQKYPLVVFLLSGNGSTEGCVYLLKPPIISAVKQENGKRLQEYSNWTHHTSPTFRFRR